MEVNRKRLLAYLAILSAFAPFLWFTVKTGQTPSTKIYVDPPATTGPTSLAFNVDISVENVTDLIAWQAWLKWDPKLLKIINVTLAGWQKWTNQSEGRIFLFIEPMESGMSGSGTLATVTFNGTGLGEGILHLYDVKLFSSKPILVSTPPYLGDVNGDMRVNVVDNGDVGRAFGASQGQPGYNPNADFNKDGFVDLFDLLCVSFNFGHTYPGDAKQPVEILHEVQDGYVNLYGSIVWKWLDYYDKPVWLIANVTAHSSYPLENFIFNRTLGGIRFDFSAATNGYCNISIPKLFMDGAFQVIINNTKVASILTWNKTHTFVYFMHNKGNYSVVIKGEIVTRIRSLDLTTIADVNGDGEVNILDISKIAVVNHWKEDN